MRINGYLDYSAIQGFEKINNTDASLQAQEIKTDALRQGENTENSTEDNTLLSKNKVIDIAVNKDMYVDRELIGKDNSLETLDIKKAISDMEKDRVLMEYRTFVNNPETVDGIVRRIQ